MTEHYVGRKTYGERDSNFEIGIANHWYLTFYIWDNKDGLYNNTRWSRKKYLGAYVGDPRRNGHGKFGEVHLLREYLGAGYVAHEIAHFVYDWFYADGNGEEFCMTSEDMAYLLGYVTAKFWTEFYERYKEARPGAGEQLQPEGGQGGVPIP